MPHELYNAAAVEIVKAHGFAANDLYAITKDVPIEYYSDMTHFYTKEGTRLLASKVINSIENSIEIKANKLDYSGFITVLYLIELSIFFEYKRLPRVNTCRTLGLSALHRFVFV